jgi:hypothetical protein
MDGWLAGNLSRAAVDTKTTLQVVLPYVSYDRISNLVTGEKRIEAGKPLFVVFQPGSG